MTKPERTITVQKRQLGNELRALREAAGLKQGEAAVVLGKANNKIGRVEKGQVGIAVADLDALLDLYAASEKDRLWCRELQKATKVRRGRPSHDTLIHAGPHWFRAFRDFERSATEIINVGAETLTGILQTEDYIRSKYAAQGGDPSSDEANEAVWARRERQALLTRDNGSRFSFVFSESALRRVVGGPRVMAAQLDFLAGVALLPTVDLQVIPFDTQSYWPISYAFTVFRFDHDAGTDIVYIEMYDNALYLDKPAEKVRRYVELHRKLTQVAIGPVESRNFILELARQFAGKSSRGS